MKFIFLIKSNIYNDTCFKIQETPEEVLPKSTVSFRYQNLNQQVMEYS